MPKKKRKNTSNSSKNAKKSKKPFAEAIAQRIQNVVDSVASNTVATPVPTTFDIAVIELSDDDETPDTLDYSVLDALLKLEVEHEEKRVVQNVGSRHLSNQLREDCLQSHLLPKILDHLRS